MYAVLGYEGFVARPEDMAQPPVMANLRVRFSDSFGSLVGYLHVNTGASGRTYYLNLNGNLFQTSIEPCFPSSSSARNFYRPVVRCRMRTLQRAMSVNGDF